MLERGARKLSDEERAKACDTVRKRGLFRVDYAVVRLNVLDEIAKEKTLDTGMRAFDSDRMRETVVYLARHVHDLYRTKLNKVLFYLDFAAYRDGGEGFTGLRYAKARSVRFPTSSSCWLPVSSTTRRSHCANRATAR